MVIITVTKIISIINSTTSAIIIIVIIMAMSFYTNFHPIWGARATQGREYKLTIDLMSLRS